ncbi:hypothetical protein D3C72_2142520 [compost metagenome]
MLVCRIDGKEVGSFQARTANQRTIDVLDAHQFQRIGRLYRAAIEDAHGLAGIAEALDEFVAHEGMGLAHVFDRRRQARADCPDRLIGDDGIFGRRLIRQ